MQYLTSTIGAFTYVSMEINMIALLVSCSICEHLLNLIYQMFPALFGRAALKTHLSRIYFIVKVIYR
jgi:hypothetical protein